MKKQKQNEYIKITVSLIFGFLVGFLIHYYFFPVKIAENQATKECEELGGKLDISYDYGKERGTSQLQFICYKSREELFVY